MAAVIGAVDDAVRALVVVGAGLGLRRGECFGLSKDRLRAGTTQDASSPSDDPDGLIFTTRPRHSAWDGRCPKGHIRPGQRLGRAYL